MGNGQWMTFGPMATANFLEIKISSDPAENVSTLLIKPRLKI